MIKYKSFLGTHEDFIDFLELVEKVKSIDEIAAYSLECLAEDDKVNYTGDLLCCFVWFDTDEGHDYWSDIHLTLEHFNEVKK